MVKNKFDAVNAS